LEQRINRTHFVPLLVVGDAFADSYYNRHAQWKYIVAFLPDDLGIFIGTAIGKDLPETTFKISMSVIIFWGHGYNDVLVDRKKIQKRSYPLGPLLDSFGTMAVLLTMIGNLAGASPIIYFFAMRLPKIQFNRYSRPGSFL